MAKKTTKKKTTKKKTEPKAVKDAIYEVTTPVWIKMVHRFPGYILTPEDIGALKFAKTFDLLLKRKTIKKA